MAGSAHLGIGCRLFFDFSTVKGDLMKKKWFFMLLTFVIMISMIFIPFRTALVFYDGKTENQQAYLILDSGDYFGITFTHSIHLTDVVEKYRITDDQKIMQYEMIYEEFGIGMPNDAMGDEEFEHIDGKYHIKNMTNEFDYLNIRNGEKVSNHRLSWGNSDDRTDVHTVPFNDYFVPGDWYKLEVKKISLFEQLKGVSIHE